MKRKITGVQNISRMCMVCGTENRAGLKAHFWELDSGELLGTFQPLPEHQGYPGRLHGGIAATLLDETMGRAVTMRDPNAWGVTIELTVRFRKPVPLDADVRAIGRITKDSSRLFESAGEIVLDDGSVAVEATGKYIKMSVERIAEGDFGEQWFDDGRPAPDEIDL